MTTKSDESGCPHPSVFFYRNGGGVIYQPGWDLIFFFLYLSIHHLLIFKTPEAIFRVSVPVVQCDSLETVSS